MTNTVILIVGAILSVSIFFLVRRGKMHGPFATWWLMVAVATIMLSAFPEWLDTIAKWVGVTYPPAFVLLIAVCMMLIKMLTMDITLTTKEQKVRRLTQRLAILEQKLEQLEELSKQQ